jgi:hypothetical protein
MKGTIILKDINIQNIINNTINLLTIKELLEVIDYDINNIYLDKFWNSIEDDKWIYLDNDTILWLGYQDIKRGKESINKILKYHLKENEDYKILPYSEFYKLNFCSAAAAEQNINEEKRGAHNKQHVIMSPDCFKELCMLVQKRQNELINMINNLDFVFCIYYNI